MDSKKNQCEGFNGHFEEHLKPKAWFGEAENKLKAFLFPIFPLKGQSKSDGRSTMAL